MDAVRAAIVAEARSWIGVPFKLRGDSRTGIDCAQLIAQIGRKILRWPEDPIFYKALSTREAFAGVRRYARRVRQSDAGPGDVVQMSFAGRAIHFGILTDEGIIHAAARGNRQVKEVRQTTMLVNRIVAYYRLRGVAAWRS
jgi:cell wall-associated NlpC family hydrolase